MDDIALYIALATFVALVLGYLVVFKVKQTSKSVEGTDVADVPDVVRPRQRPVAQAADGGPRNRAQASRANARARMRVAQSQRQHHSDSEAEADDVEQDISESIVLPDGKVGKKKMAKLQAKAEKKANREAEIREREEKKERDDQEYEERKQKEQKEEEEEAKLEEELRLKRLEDEKQEQEEYEKMKAAFSVEEEGYVEDEDEAKQADLLQRFINYIKESKVVVLEDLASKFDLKTQAVIDRITDLQKNGTLTGVVDDRGKFIYITTDELESVAKFIRQRGRITIAELSEASNSLINLGQGEKQTECS